jgi:hypothetical protein
MAQLQASTVAGTLTTTGNVGIGITNPTARLQATGVITYDAGITAAGNTVNGVGLGLNNANGHDWYLISTGTGNGGGANNLGFYDATAGEYRVYFKGDGNVGIGTVNPTAKLEVIGSGGARQTMLQLTGAGTSDEGLFVTTTGNGNDYYAIKVATGGDSSAFAVTNAGNVGIGITTPNAKLDVAGNTRLGSGTLHISTDQSFATSFTYSFRDGVGIVNPNGTSAAVGTAVMSIGGMSNGVSLITTAAVGIGTTVPAQSLDVNGKIRLRDGGNTTIPSIQMNPGGTMGFSNPSNEDISIITASTTKVFIKQDGNVGINTTNPITRLHVNYTSGTGLTLSNTVASLYAEMRFQSANSSAYIFKSSNGYTSYGGANALNIYNEGQISFSSSTTSNILYLAANGNVGIGTINPLTKLHVVGNALISTGITAGDSKFYNSVQLTDSLGGNTESWIWAGAADSLYMGVGTVSAGNTKMVINSSGNVGIGITTPTAKLHTGPENWASDPGGKNYSGVAINTSGSDIATGRVFFQGYNLGATDVIGLNNEPSRMVLYNYTDTQYLQLWDHSGNIYMATAAGNVGIGTTSTDARLDVFGPNSSVGTIKWQNDGGRRAGYLYSDTAGIAIYDTALTQAGIYIASNNRIDFRVNGSERMRIDSSGNVGIGTTSAGAKLNVVTDTTSQDQVAIFQGTGNLGAGVHLKASGAGGNTWRLISTGASSTPGADRFGIYSDSAGLYRLVMDDNGRVGIGVTNPAYRLEINGNVYGTTTAQFGSSYIVGNQSGWAIFGSNSTANGIKIVLDGNVARNDLVIAGTSGNVGIGSSAPAYKLDVTDAARVDGVRLGRDFSIAGRATVRLDSDGNYPADVLFGQTAAANQTSWDGVYWSISSRDSGASASQGQKFTIWRGAAHSAPNNSENQFISITPDLNMGISTTSPAYKLDVAGTGRYTDVLRLDHVGTAHGDGALYIAGVNTCFDWSNGLLFRGTGTSWSARFTGTSEMSAAGQILGVYKEETSPGTIGGIIATFNNDGNVGVGVETPSYRLDVAGDTNNNSFRVYSSNTAGPAVAIQNTSTGGKNWQLISNGSSNADGTGRLQFWQSTDSFTALTVGFNGGEDTNIYTPVHIDSTATGATTYPFRTDAASLDYALYVSSSGNVAIGGLVPAAALNHKLVVFSGSIALRGPNDPNFSYRLNDTGGTNRNALYVSSSNYLNVGNAAFAGIELFHTGSAPDRKDGDPGGINGYYGSDGATYLAEPNKWLAVRVAGTNYVIPMYE